MADSPSFASAGILPRPNRGPRRGDRPSAWQINKATVRILDVLSAFASEQTSFGVTELSQRLGMTKNMAFRALTTLVDQGYLVRAESGARYELGFRVIELQSPAQREPDLRTLARPAIMQMYELSGETALVVVRTGHSVVVIDGVEPAAAVVSRAPIGSTFPLHVSPTARAVLAQLSDQEIADYIARNAPLKRVTETTITDPAALWDEVRLVRERGYALGYGDSTPGKVSVAFPIFDAEGRVWGSIATGGPGERFTHKRLMELMPQLTQIMRALNARTRLFHADPSPPVVG